MDRLSGGTNRDDGLSSEEDVDEDNDVELMAVMADAKSIADSTLERSDLPALNGLIIWRMLGFCSGR
jgi:hypothetical protein